MKEIVFICVALTATVASAAEPSTDRLSNWHHWRGPEATGVAPLANPPLQWDEESNLQWKVEIPGRGSSTPIIWNDRVFILTAINTGREGEVAPPPANQPPNPFGIKTPNTFYRFVVMCFDRASGQLLWEQTAAEVLPHEGHHQDNSFASASPTTDGRYLYVSFGSRGLYCYDLDGKPQWKYPLPAVQTRLSFGEASSPVIHGDSLVLNRDNDGKSQIVVLDAQTGKLRWTRDRDEMSAWATPLVVDYAGRTQVITNASNRVRSYDLATGEVIWQCGGQVGNVIPSPVRYGDQVLCLSGYKGSAAFAIPLDSKGDITGTDRIAWHYDRDTPYVPSPLLYGDLVYFNKQNSGILTCLNAKTGKPAWEAKRLPDLANVYASPVGAADRVYFVGRDGTTTVLKHGPTLEILSTNKLNDPVDASPAVAGKQLFLRSRKFLYCLAEK
jgi:outer membrane protein assembly factor BamB